MVIFLNIYNLIGEFGINIKFLTVCWNPLELQLRCSESTRVKGNWVNFIIFINNGEDCSKSIVRDISFHNELSIGNPMSKDRSGGKCFLKRVESILTGGIELPRSVLLDEVCQWSDNVRVVEDELAVKVSET